MPASIPVVDDDINEATEQFFVVHMEVLEAPNPEQITGDQQDVSICTILDNDSKNDILLYLQCTYDYR